MMKIAPPFQGVVISYMQVVPVLAAWEQGEHYASISTDLGRSETKVRLEADGIWFPTGEHITWERAQEIAENETTCFAVTGEAAEEIRAYSEVTHWARSLYPTEGAPTMLVSGITMHRIVGTDPTRDTLKKIKALAPIRGMVLDTATGLGYTAIEASRTADKVVSVEIDQTALDIAAHNPWSRELFNNPRIELVVGDVYDFVVDSEDGTFSCIMHDPPTFNLAGELYSLDFYRELHRILRRRGRVFHYIGNLESKSGQGVLRGVVKRLHEAGFSRVQRRPEAFGVTAYK